MKTLYYFFVAYSGSLIKPCHKFSQNSILFSVEASLVSIIFVARQQRLQECICSLLTVLRKEQRNILRKGLFSLSTNKYGEAEPKKTRPM